LQQLLEVILAHDRLGHGHEGLFGICTHFLAGIFEVVRQLAQQFVVVVEE